MKTKLFRFSTSISMVVVLLAGCAPLKSVYDGDVQDKVLGKRYESVSCDDPLLLAAQQLTCLEDDIRRDGSIVVKQPDVWGDADLTSMIQEHDWIMRATVDDFKETVQAYIARSDQAAFQSETAIGLAASGDAPAALTKNMTNASEAKTTLIDLGDVELFKTLATALAGTSLNSDAKTGVGVEPTELLRQQSNYIHVNQALRRRAMGDDNSRAAGYGLYKFRIPVSVLPGRQTHEGYSAVVSVQAHLDIDTTHLKNTIPKLAIADVVDFVDNHYSQKLNVSDSVSVSDTKAKKDYCSLKGESCASTASSTEVLPTPYPLCKVEALSLRMIPAAAPANQEATAGVEVKVSETVRIPAGTTLTRFDFETRKAMNNVICKRFGGEVPKRAELRSFLFSYFGQIYNNLESRKALESLDYTYDSSLTPQNTTPNTKYNILIDAAERHIKGLSTCENQTKWEGKVVCSVGEIDSDDLKTSWMLALQLGILDANLKKIAKDLKAQGKLTDEGSLEYVEFFNPSDAGLANAFPYWKQIIEKEFPLNVFTLEPQVDEQNVYDAFSRSREIQLALAIRVASGKANIAHAMAASRKLQLDMVSIGLNRTQVAFSHDNDSFGWYFHPRVQSPPPERNNIAALGRLIWSTGPTERYDLKHRNIEPGIRDCEVLIAMPSFVTGVTFDVTTNWEKIDRPGVTKRSYEEMIARGCFLSRTRSQLMRATECSGHRPGDKRRLIARVDQLEKMLSLQTYEVSVPFAYEQSGTDLFDKGDQQVKPILHSHYGLDFVVTGGAACAEGTENISFFLTGKNFHPTNTHVIIGGHETSSTAEWISKEEVSTVADATTTVKHLPQPEVKVLSRELLEVKIPKLNALLSKKNSFQIRVGTPYGVSNPLTITSREKCKPPTTPAPKPPAEIKTTTICTEKKNTFRNLLGGETTAKTNVHSTVVEATEKP